MSDLPQRLRFNATIPMVMEAADRIEALEAALREIDSQSTEYNVRNLARAALAPDASK